MYATVPQLIAAFGIVEIARLCDTDEAPYLVTPALFKAAAAGEAVVGTPEEVAATVAALARASDALRRASTRMDSYIGMRYPLPLLVVVIGQNSLEQVCLNIARFLLQDNRATDEVRARYKDDIDWLTQISVGKAALVGADDAPATAANGGTRHGQARSNFDWAGY